MKNSKAAKPFWQVLTLGTLAGMRTMSAPAIASHNLSHNQSRQLTGSPLKFMQSAQAAIVFKALAAGEIIGDKLPNTPNRTAVAGIVGRCLSGALAGACIYRATGNNALTGAFLGSITALGATFGSFYLRKSITEKTHIYDPVCGAIEDVLVIGTGTVLAMTT